MQTNNGVAKTANPEARRSFVHGERSFRAYLAGGNVQFLQEAKTSFLQAIRRDQKFDLARFYLGVTQTQLRETDESIPTLTRLQDAGTMFGGQVVMQLAYAHIKKYEEPSYFAAEELLTNAIKDASLRNQSGFLLQAQALKVFLYSVMAGRLKDEDRRPNYARFALLLAEQVIAELDQAEPTIADAALFDTYNALGIVWMRIGEARWAGFEGEEVSWVKSEQYYDRALRLRPNAVPVLQNIGTLRLAQAKSAEQNGQSERAGMLRDEAKALYLQSLVINDHDQFPYYRLAGIAVQERDKHEALERIRVGRSKPGAVKDAEWEKVSSEAHALPETS